MSIQLIPDSKLSPESQLNEETIQTLLSSEKTSSYQKLQELKELAIDWEVNQGINPFKLYCSRTGREIGSLTDSIIHSSLASIASSDNEEIMDELTSRCLLASRPSPDLIYLSGDSMKALISHDPTTALIFYLSKAFESRNRDFMAISPTHKSSRKKHQFDSSESAIDAKLKWNRGLIELHAVINRKIPVKNIKRFCFLLLSIDSKLGLHKLTPPQDLWGFDLITKEKAFPQCMKLIKHYQKELNKIEKQNNLFMQNVNSLSFDTVATIRQTAGKKKAPKQRAKERRINNMTAKLDNILQSIADSPIDFAPQSHPKPVNPKPSLVRPTGLKIRIKRKETPNENQS